MKINEVMSVLTLAISVCLPSPAKSQGGRFADTTIVHKVDGGYAIDATNKSLITVLAAVAAAAQVNFNTERIGSTIVTLHARVPEGALIDVLRSEAQSFGLSIKGDTAGSKFITIEGPPSGVAQKAPVQQSVRATSGPAVDGVVTRTVAVHYLKPSTAVELLLPYAYGASNIGVSSVSDDLMAITITQKPSVIAEMEKVLAQFDVKPASLTLTFELILADTSGTRDPQIQGLDSLLRGVLRYSGYKLVGRAMESVTQGTSYHGSLSGDPAGGGNLYLSASVGPIQQDGGVASVELGVDLMRPSASGGAPLLGTQVTVPIGQTVMLGTAAGARSGSALILTVRPELAAPPHSRE